MKKHKLLNVPDIHGDGFMMKYLFGESTILDNTKYLLIIDYDTCSTLEQWKLIRKYRAISNSIPRDEYLQSIVYSGEEVPENLIDTLIDLVIESQYLNFRELSDEEIVEYLSAPKKEMK